MIQALWQRNQSVQEAQHVYYLQLTERLGYYIQLNEQEGGIITDKQGGKFLHTAEQGVRFRWFL